MDKYIISLDKVSGEMLPKVGGKNGNLGEMIQNLGSLGIEIPKGFAITVDAFEDFISENNLRQEIEESIASIDWNDWLSLKKAGGYIRQQIRNGEFS
ncbi:MAG TPA: PEP/pyruvate-binding domain-containing protein, partial [Bacteroidia bacterium]|nr:PEP/pyruvate-binding domain-containing protein [Bacteroidia bacterium]